MWGYYDYKPLAVRRKEAEGQLAKLIKKNPDISPITIHGKKIINTWWGEAWVKNLESYADYSNRIGRGRSYIRNGFVFDLQISQGHVYAQVMGSSLYNVKITIPPLKDKKWNTLTQLANRKIECLQALLEGKFPKELEDVFKDKQIGLFPNPKEIKLSCTCPDWADMCKHVSAALYGIGARFDDDPTLFFKLRAVSFEELLKKSIDQKMQSMLDNAKKAELKSKRIIEDTDINKLFGLKI